MALLLLYGESAYFDTDFTDYTVFVVAIGIQAPEFLLRTILWRRKIESNHQRGR
jgi:hypothetical protein